MLCPTLSNTVSGVTSPSWIAPDIVITLLVEPGSYTSVTVRLFAMPSATCAGSVSLAPSTTAIESTSPVCTSTITAVPPFAFIDGHALQQ